MSREQIEEMAIILDSTNCANIPIDECARKDDCAHCQAERLYNEGYRKQRKGEWLPSPSGSTNVYCSLCGAMGDGGIYCSHCGAKMKGAKK